MENCCSYCEKKFKHLSSLNKHIKSVHGVLPDSSKCNILCPKEAWDMKFSRKVTFHKHLVEVHQINLEVENKEFSNVAEFEAWKGYIEIETKCIYSKREGAKILATGVKVLYFHCHRSGCYKSKASGKRAKKGSGTIKINSTCPSSMHVIIEENKLSVKFQKTHVGHQEDIAHLFISDKDRSEIADGA